MRFQAPDYIRALLFMLLTFVGASAVAQPFQQYVPDVHHYGIREALKHRHIHCTFQDSEGFMWVATHRGLNRYDGHEFVPVSSIPDGVDGVPTTRLAS